MASNPFKRSGRRLGSATTNIPERPIHSDTPITPATRFNVDSAGGTEDHITIEMANGDAVVTLFNDLPSNAPSTDLTSRIVSRAAHNREESRDSDDSTASIVSTASTASLTSRVAPIDIQSASTARGVPGKPENELPSVQAHFNGYKLLDILSVADKQAFDVWSRNQRLRFPQSLESWYYQVRPPPRIYARVAVAPKPPIERQTSLKLVPSASLPRVLHVPATVVTTVPVVTHIPESEITFGPRIDGSFIYPKNIPLLIRGEGDAMPGVFRYPTVLKTWCEGYTRDRDIKIEEILQKSRLSKGVVISPHWEKSFMENKTTANTTWEILVSYHCPSSLSKMPQVRPSSAIVASLIPNLIESMEAKIMLLFFQATGDLRIVISTTGVRSSSWGENGGTHEGMVVLIDLPKASNNHDQTVTQFGIDLSAYCLALGVNKDTLVDFLNYDWEETRDLIFVSSRPSVNDEEAPYNGLTGLALQLNQAGLTFEGELEIDYVTSSIKKFDVDFLAYLYQTCKGTTLPKPEQCKDQIGHEEIESNVRVYFPSDDTVTKSKAGRENVLNLDFWKSTYNSLGSVKKVLHDSKSLRARCLTNMNLIFVQPRRVLVGIKTGAVPVVQPVREATPWYKRKAWRSVRDMEESGDSRFEQEARTELQVSGGPTGTAIEKPRTPWVYVGSAGASWGAWGHPKDFKLKGINGYTTGCNWQCGVIIPVRDNATCSTGTDGFHNLDVFSSIMPIPIRCNSERLDTDARQPWFRSHLS